MKDIAYLFAGILGLAFSCMGLVFARISGVQFFYLIGSLLLLAYTAVIVYFVRKLKYEGKPPSALILISPIYLVIGVLSVFSFGMYVVSLLKPDSEAFTKQCKETGAKYLKLPSSPVRSIAYDWNSKIAPSMNGFEVSFGTRMKTRSFNDFPYPGEIKFTERKRSRHEGRPSEGADESYIRFPRDRPYYGISSITADILVQYSIHPEEELEEAETNQGEVHYELVVTDRRTNERLASLNYIVDAERSRACGLTGKNVMSERDFVLKAVGLQ